MMALASLGSQACTAETEGGETDEEGASTDDITKVENTKVKRQSIGNCWLYAVQSWVESMNKRATGVDANFSESYLTYWHWFEQVANRSWTTEISTGGSYGVASDLILRYGMISEGKFIPAEAEAEMSNRQSTALAAINKSLKEGALKDPNARRDRKLVRQEFDKAWGLTPEVSAMLDKVFGQDVSRTIDRGYRTRKTGTDILRPRDVPVSVPNATTRQAERTTLAEAIGTGSSWSRTGKYAFQEVDYPSDEAGRRRMQIRVQRALHDGAPIVVSWAVDFNALTSDSKFSKQELDRRGPGRQGGHMTIITDYQIKLPDGRVLKAGESNYSQADLDAALKNESKVEFFRVKNSWGSLRPDRWQVGDGYHDLMIDYLNGPIKKCAEVNGTSDPNNCPSMQNPWWDAVLPAGY
jgi:hypothetical protein